MLDLMLLNVPDEKEVCRQLLVFRAINRALTTLANEDQRSENKLVITEEFTFDQNKLSKDPNNHFKSTLVYLRTILVENPLILRVSMGNNFSTSAEILMNFTCIITLWSFINLMIRNSFYCLLINVDRKTHWHFES